LALEGFDFFRCAILAASQAAISMVVHLEANGFEARLRGPSPRTKPPLLLGGAYTVEENDQDYSWRRTRIGSALDARCAGMSAAKKASSSNAPALKAIVAGSAEVVS
jgi:hypothetical protein